MVKEKIEPGRDIFAEPIQENKVKIETIGGVDPAVLEEEQKAKDERMRSMIEKLKTKVGPLSPSEAIVKAAIEEAEYDAIVKDPSKDDSKPKEDEQKADLKPTNDAQKAESAAPQGQKTEEKAKSVEETKDKVVQETEDKVAKPKKEDAHDKEEKDESTSSIQPAPISTHDEEEEKKEKKTPTPEEIEADRVRKELFGKEKG